MFVYSHLRGAWLWTALTVAACGGILLSNTIYLESGVTARFLLEKGSLARDPCWLAAFFFHVVGASLCLTAGTPLMFPVWTRRQPRWHKFLGYVYLNAVLWMAAPTGIYLALTAKGGVLGSAGFLVAGVMWWQTTWLGYRAIRRGDMAGHIRGMVRSYCWALSAPAFRIFQASLFYCGTEDTANYVLSLWLSIAASVVLAESCLARSRSSTASFVPSPSINPGVSL
jgi:hypothetical protein